MGLSFNIPNYAGNIPWFMFDLSNYQLITSITAPSDIKDIKSLVFTETPIPGKNFSPIFPSGNGNRKISFTLPLIKRNNTIGNILILKQFEMLRNQSTNFLDFSATQFSPNPKVLFFWGVGGVPLVYYVSRCDFSHKQGWINQIGNPQYSEVEIELILDETHPLYKAEEMFRKVSAMTGQVLNAYEVSSAFITGDKTI